MKSSRKLLNSPFVNNPFKGTPGIKEGLFFFFLGLALLALGKVYNVLAGEARQKRLSFFSFQLQKLSHRRDNHHGYLVSVVNSIFHIV